MALIKDSITEQVREFLQNEIEAGTIAPGERILEHKLAEQLGVSKTPLRLALHQLKQDRIVRIEPRQGIYLATPTAQEVLELIELREAMEGVAARRVARGAEPQIVDQMRACFAGFSDDNVNDARKKYAHADHRFHRLLVTAAGNRELVRVLEVINLRLHMNRLRRIFSRGHDLRPLHREHIAIIDAIAAGDARKAEVLARAHVRNVPWQLVMSEITASSPRAAGPPGEAA
jgi:DNA-binding GntR family transcriptional regulator